MTSQDKASRHLEHTALQRYGVDQAALKPGEGGDAGRVASWMQAALYRWYTRDDVAVCCCLMVYIWDILGHYGGILSHFAL